MIEPYQAIGLVPIMRECAIDIRGPYPHPHVGNGLFTDQYQLIYEEPIYPKNLYLDRAPYAHGEYRREVIDRQVELMHERDVWRRPGKP